MELLGVRPNHANVNFNARALVILLELGKVNSFSPKILFGRCFEGLNDDQILGWDISTIEVLGQGHRQFL